MADVMSNSYAKTRISCLRISLLLLLCYQSTQTPAFAQEPTDTVYNLTELEVYSTNSPGMVKMDKSGQLTLSRGELKNNLRIAGFADAINALSSLPGFSSASDYSSGVSMNGAGYDQISYTYADAPLFFPYHFGGLMSTFNTNHLRQVNVNRAYSEIGGPDRTGGSIDVSPIGRHEKLGIMAECGFIASSATLKLPIGLSISGRVSYLNELFPWLLTVEEADIRYRLSDVNVTYTSTLNDKDLMDVNIIGSADRLRYDDGAFGIDTSMKWYNNLFSFTYRHAENLRCSIYFSAFGSVLVCEMPPINLKVPSSIRQTGASLNWGIQPHVDVGWRTEFTHNALQMPKYSVNNGDNGKIIDPRQTSWYNKLHTRYHNSFGPLFLETAVSLALVKNRLLPGLRISVGKRWDFHSLKIAADASSQYISQIGMSDIGMASNFFVVANEYVKASKAYGIDLVMNNSWIDGLLSNSLEIYGKKIFNEPEYTGNIFDMIDETYNPYNHIMTTNGYNVGASLLLKCNTHPVSGWVGLAAGMSRRRYEDGKYHPSPYDIPLSCTLQVNWVITPRVGVSGIFTAHSGHAYTGISSIYIMGGNVILEYGERNGSRLPDYHRLDLSCNYFFKDFKLGKSNARHFLNFSLLNVYGHKNIEIQYYRFNSKTNEIYLRRNGSLYRFLPSLSYTIEL